MARRILIVGGGYAGALCAVRLARKSRGAGVQVVLANARPWFVERIRLHQDAARGAGRAAIARRPLARMLSGTGVDLRIGTVESVDLARRRAYLALGRPGDPVEALAFDELVLATGSAGDSRGVPGLEHAWSCVTEEQAHALHARLASVAGGRVLIAGGGLTGVELATELGERRPDLRVTLLASGDVGFMLAPRAREHVRRALERLGVELREHTRVAATERDGVVLASGEALPSHATVWCGGFEAAPLARDAGLDVDERGRAFVDARLRSTSHDFVRVIGDAAHVATRGPDGAPQTLRMACATAVPQGAFCADDLAGQASQAFSFGFAGQCLSLGRRDAVIQRSDPYDAPQSAWLGGRPGALLKELVCRYPVFSIALERRGIGYAWPKAPRLRAPAAPAALAATTTRPL